MIIAVDTGGTKTLVAKLSNEGEIVTSDKFATPRDTDEYLKLLAASINLVAENKKPSIVVVAVPGWIENDIVISCGNLPWRNFPIKTELAKRFPGSAIWIENDANLGGLGEVSLREKPPRRCLYVTISTGIGGGFIIDGLIDQSTRTAEIGHMALEFDDEIVRWESIASGKALSLTYHKLAEDLTDGRNWRAVANRISRGFLAFLPVLRPDLVIIGGSVGAHFDNFAEYLEKDLAKHLPADYRCPIVQAKHPEKAVIYGCYHYAISRNG